MVIVCEHHCHALIGWCGIFGARNDLVSVFHQTLTFYVKGRVAPDYTHEVEPRVHNIYMGESI